MWVGLTLIVVIFIFLVRDNSKSYNLRQKADQLEAENRKLESDIQDLEYKITYYNTPEYKERIAREVLGLQSPGESVIIVPKPENPTSGDEQEAEAPKEIKKSNFRQWMDFLFGS